MMTGTVIGTHLDPIVQINSSFTCFNKSSLSSFARPQFSSQFISQKKYLADVLLTSTSMKIFPCIDLND